ncbi:fumarylacetoacetate hydrolase family protein [Cochlodiniinecator piscidefendens]|uniref:fumarylacetoacetate hydrolase family protein n=1 Tax=Cochlodiniinecator piscidefendens TaxID=2715756 RepID=UPI00140B50A3|nr:fumarylacetoacetate hydrolase family protein [Cochlodiniinecator piscidefendens]
MTQFVVPSVEVSSVAIFGSNLRFPVRRIFCVGRNYAEHAREMGNDPDREPPFFFTKPADAIVDDAAILPFPSQTENLHHEAELVVAIDTGGTDITPNDALAHVWGYGVGNDLTRRDMQAAAKAARRPWDMAKGFDNSAVCGPLHPVAESGHIESGAITAHVNGNCRQTGDVADMIWSISDIVATLSGLVTLAPGDLIYTGTPAGVGPIKPGDSCTIAINGLGSVTTTFAAN